MECSDDNPLSSLFIAEMENSWALSSEAVEIAVPEYAWENKGYKVNDKSNC
jgi:GH43 family beta-xylosidase